MTGDMNTTAVGMFSVFVIFTLGITYWAASKMTSTKHF